MSWKLFRYLPQRTILISLYACIFGALLVVAQQDCEALDDNIIIQSVDTVCNTVNPNQACYGNVRVNAIPQEGAPLFEFQQPGDNADLQYIQSLFLSELNPEEDTWGVAKLRLLANLTQGTEDVTIFLFGDVQVNNEVESSVLMPVRSTVEGFITVRSSPSINANNVVGSARPGVEINALARNDSSTWIRVQVPSQGVVGWVSSLEVTPTNEEDRFENLTINREDVPFFGPMQSFTYISDGDGTSNCNDVQADGMFIQTPEGLARVTLLINEVSVELLSSEQYGSTAFITSNPQDGMTVSMLTGGANITSNGTTQFVDANMQTTIRVNDDGIASGSPQIPVTIDLDAIRNINLLPALANSEAVGAPDVGVGEAIAMLNVGGDTGSAPSAVNTDGSSNPNNSATGSNSGNTGSGAAGGSSQTDASGQATGAVATAMPLGSLSDLQSQAVPASTEEDFEIINIIIIIGVIIISIALGFFFVFFNETVPEESE